MMRTQSQRKQTFLQKRTGVMLGIPSWPCVSMLFDPHFRYTIFFKPIGVFSRSSLAPEWYSWSIS